MAAPTLSPTPGSTRPWPRGLVAIAITMLSGGVCGQAPASMVRTSKHFAVHCHMEELFAPLAEGLAAEALATAERAWPVLERLGLARAGPLREIHLHADTRSFRTVEKSQSNHAFLVEAFVNVAATQSHVLMWPELPAAIRQRMGLTQGTRQDIVRVVAEQAVAQLLADGGSDPWLRDVLVMGVVEGVFNPRHESETDAHHDTRRRRVDAGLQSQARPCSPAERRRASCASGSATTIVRCSRCSSSPVAA